MSLKEITRRDMIPSITVEILYRSTYPILIYCFPGNVSSIRYFADFQRDSLDKIRVSFIFRVEIASSKSLKPITDGRNNKIVTTFSKQYKSAVTFALF